MTSPNEQKGFEWQLDIWNDMSAIYHEAIDTRFVPVIKHLISLCSPTADQTVLDLGCGTGAVAAAVARTFNLERQITAVDISPKMLERARSCFAELGLSGIVCREGRAEELPVEDNSQDLILASLSFMYVVDRAAAAREIARALTPDGKFIAVVWGSRDNTDIVRFQEIAGSFAPTPPVTAVGPGSLGDPQPFVTALQEQGLTVTVDSIVTTFEFPDFDTSWEPLAGVTAKKLDKDTLHRARAAVYSEMWPDGDGPRVFQNTTQYITAVKSP